MMGGEGKSSGVINEIKKGKNSRDYQSFIALGQLVKLLQFWDKCRESLGLVFLLLADLPLMPSDKKNDRSIYPAVQTGKILRSVSYDPYIQYTICKCTQPLQQEYFSKVFTTSQNYMMSPLVGKFLKEVGCICRGADGLLDFS